MLYIKQHFHSKMMCALQCVNRKASPQDALNTGNAMSYYSSFQRVVITAAVGPN